MAKLKVKEAQEKVRDAASVIYAICEGIHRFIHEYPSIGPEGGRIAGGASYASVLVYDIAQREEMDFDEMNQAMEIFHCVAQAVAQFLNTDIVIQSPGASFVSRGLLAAAKNGIDSVECWNVTASEGKG